jgi:NAD(P)-dependent dehydrogenase (short-subunit alcohol dehydrogenase family)
VVLNARSTDDLSAIAEQVHETGGHAAIVPGDISQPSTARTLVSTSLATFGRIDSVINNAGVLQPLAPIAASDPEDWARNLAINLSGPYLLIREALPYLRAVHGRVINVSSGAAVKATAGWSAYCASKAALNHLTAVLATEEPMVTSIAFRPGVVDTAMQATIRAEGEAGMNSADHQRFLSYFAEDQLMSPELPGTALAVLALHAPHEWSGEFITWNELRVQALVEIHS